MSLEVRQLVLRASVQEQSDDDDEDDDAAVSRKASTCSGAEAEDPCADKESLKEEILAACRALLREELRALRER
jgi:hypothetical protein